jgi:hypothetical protein
MQSLNAAPPESGLRKSRRRSHNDLLRDVEQLAPEVVASEGGHAIQGSLARPARRGLRFSS